MNSLTLSPDRGRLAAFLGLMLLACGLFPGAGRAQETNLVTWLKFDDGAGTNALDSSPSGNTGALYNMGTAPTNWVTGKIGGALAFDGVSDYVRVTNIIGDDFTIALWISTTQVVQQTDLTYRGTGLAWSDVGGSTNDFILGLTRSSGGVNRASFFTGNPDVSINGVSAVNSGGWVHIAATRQKQTGTLSLYVNGTLEASATGGTGRLNANPNIHIGGNTLDSRYFAGTVDDLRLYNRVLSGPEIAALAGVTNRAPLAGTDKLTVVSNAPTTVAAALLLQNDSDPDGDPLTVTAVSASSVAGGTVGLSGSSVTYTPPANYLGGDQFTYQISDSRGGTATGTVQVTVTQYGWALGTAPLLTRWATNVSPASVLPEYPRPQMVRNQWLNLNGLWDYVFLPTNATAPSYWAGKILVPYPVESALSGVTRSLSPTNRLWYHRSFTVPSAWAGQRVLLHFGAVDWQATVWVNGTLVGTHRGGYDPFTLDITDVLAGSGAQDLLVAVWDPTDSGSQPRGKQVLKPSGIWYTASSGIWQTPWLEPVPTQSIASFQLVPDVAGGALRLSATVQGPANSLSLQAVAADSGQPIAYATGASTNLTLTLPNVKLWSPDNPFLYDLQLILRSNGVPVDQVASYFAMRQVAVAPDSTGVQRLFLNGAPVFHVGPLDQGFWPDGLYTAPTDEALRSDLDVLKQLGFNTVRKHVKVEPDRWYYYCDRLGFLVWQDMPSGNNGNAAAQQEFQAELTNVVQALWNHPCIVMWVPFNEGWGQFNTAGVVAQVQALDPYRLVDNASGWTDAGVGNVHDVHTYPAPGAPALETNRAGVVGEFGGLGHVVSGHCWNENASWGYQTYTNIDDLTARYVDLLTQARDQGWWNGLSGAIYTQTSDVEVEVNGLMTYDRAILKMPVDPVAVANRLARVALPAPVTYVVLPTAQQQGALWLYVTNDPGPNWQAPGFDDSGWSNGLAGFGTSGTPGAVVRTTWNTSDIWLRRTFDAPGLTNAMLLLRCHHDEGAELYFNGVLALSVSGYTTAYQSYEISEAARAALQPSNNLFAVHCHQTGGGQYVDAGLVAAQTYVSLGNPVYQPNQGLVLTLAGDLNAPWTLRSTTNLAGGPGAWTTLTNGVLSASPWQWMDRSATNVPSRFYRLSLP